MCYAGGPYCDRNVKPRLDKAKKAFVEDRTPENLQALKEVQFEYDSTPKGQKLLKEKMSTLTSDEDDGSQLIALGERLEKAEARRAYEMQQYHSRQNKNKGKVISQTDKKRKDSSLPSTEKEIMSAESQEFPMKSRLEAKDVYGYDNVKELEPDHFSDIQYSIDCDVQGENPRNCGCYPDDAHRCYTIESVEIDKDSISNIANKTYPSYHRLSPEQKNEINDIYEKHGALDEDNYSVSIYKGYYGDEYEVSFNNEVNLVKDLNLYALSAPNNSDRNEVLAMARESGVDTRHKTPVNIVKEELIKRNSGRVARYLKSVKNVSYKSSISSHSINIPKKRPGQGDRDKSIFKHGILYDNGDGTYTAVGNIGQVEKTKNDPDIIGGTYMVLSK